MKLKLKLATLTFALLSSVLTLAPSAQAYLCCVSGSIPSCDFEVPNEGFTYCAENNYGVACEQEARQYCGMQVSCPNGNSGYGDTITCGKTMWYD